MEHGFDNRNYKLIQKYVEERGLNEVIALRLGFKINTIRAHKRIYGEEWKRADDLSLMFTHYDLDGYELEDWACGVGFVLPSSFNPNAAVKRIRWGVSGKGSRIWAHPLCDWRASGLDVDIYESVLKAALAHKLTGRHSIGLNGVWTGAPKGVLDPMLDELLHSDAIKRVRLIFDDDVRRNPNVQRAQDKLAGLIQERDIPVWIHNVPEGMDDLNTMWKQAGGFKGGAGDEYVTEWLGGPEGEAGVVGQYVGLPGALAKLNTEVVLIRNGSYIYEEATGITMSRGEFKDVNYADRQVLIPNPNGKKGEVKVSAADEWLKWEDRRTVERAVFKVGDEHIKEGVFVNDWQDDSLEAVPYTDAEREFVLGFIEEQVNELGVYIHLINMLAWHVQNPGQPPMNYLVLVSTRGHTGKSLLLDGLYKPLFGKWSWGVSAELWHSQWTPYYRSQFVLYEEAFSDPKKGKAEMATLKNLATATMLTYNDKNVRMLEVHKGFMLAVTTNDMNALAIGKFDRRAFVVEFGEQPARSGAEMARWADDISERLRASGSGVGFAGKFKQMLLDWECMEVNGNMFDPRADAPMTEAKEVMQDNALSAMELFVRDLREGWSGAEGLFRGRRYITATELGVRYLAKTGVGDVASPAGLARSVAVVMSNFGYVKSRQIKISKDLEGKAGLPRVATYWDISGQKGKIDATEVRADIEKYVSVKY